MSTYDLLTVGYKRETKTKPSDAYLRRRRLRRWQAIAAAKVPHSELIDETRQPASVDASGTGHERGGIKVYETALECAVNKDLQEEWTPRYLDETRNHEAILMDLCNVMEIDPEEESPARAIVREMGESLVGAMTFAQSGDDPEAAELVACECVTLAETKDHLNWELLGKCADYLSGQQKEKLKKAWCRELWIQWLGMKAVLPPPEERKHVKTAIGAARAEMSAPKKR